MAFSDRMTALALKLITKFGVATTFTRANISGYDPATLQYTETAASTFTVQCADIEARGRDYSRMEQVGVSLTKRNKVLYIPSGAYVPKLGDTATVASIVYRVMAIVEYRAQNVTCAYEMIVSA